jgi:hypothetical protein
MNTLHIRLIDDRQQFRPGETIRGEASWQLTRSAQIIEARLCWFTSGRTIPEAGLIGRCSFARPQLSETRPFEFVLPEGPYSFQGALIQLDWAIELVALPSEDCARTVFSVSPDGQPILLQPAQARLAA